MIAKTEEEIKNLRVAGQILAGVLDDLQKLAKDGVSAAELDLAAEHAIRARGGVPAFLGYKPEGQEHPYPATLCVSLNDEVVHGLPHAEKVLHTGDLVMLDLGLSYHGYFADAAISFCIGKGDFKTEQLIVAAKEALATAVSVARPGRHMGDIGAAIEAVAKKYNFTVPHELGGHGLGKVPHEAPFVPNFGRSGEGEELVEGMVLAIEPILCAGKSALTEDADGWTLRTKDHSRSAEFEHTVLITKEGAEILTQL